MSTPAHVNPPYRAEHVGSLKRPAQLLQKRIELGAGKCTPADLKIAEDEALKGIVQIQREAGIKSITDGECRRQQFFDGVFDALEGMYYREDVPSYMFMSYVPDIAAFQKLFPRNATYICEGKLKRTKPFYVSQFESLKQATSPEEHKSLKVNMCAPGWYHLHHGAYTYNKDVYKNDSEYFADIAKAYQEEIQDLYASGCRNIQFDDPNFAYFCAESMITGMEEQGVDHQALLDSYIKLYSDCLKGRPTDINIGIHMCRGNFKGGVHFSEGGYNRVASRLFNEIDVDCYYLEYDTDRAGSFDPLKFLPKNKVIVLGLVSSKVPELETVEELKERVNQAAEVIAQGQPKRSKTEALNQICISPQCGFASHFEGNPVTEEDVKKKLMLVSETAKAIWA